MTEPLLLLTKDLPTSLPSTKGLFNRATEFNLAAWFQANPALVTKDGTSAAVSLVNAKVGGAISYLNNTGSQQPIYTESQFGAFPGFKFDGTDDRLITAWTGAPSRSGAWSVALVARLTAPSAQVCLMGSWTSAGVGSLVSVSNTTNILSFQHGSGILAGPNLSTAGLYGKPLLIIFGSDGDNLFLRVNGTSYVSVASNNAASTQQWVFGALNSSGAQPFNGSIGDVIFANFVINNNREILDAVEAYAARFMGVTMAWQA